MTSLLNETTAILDRLIAFDTISTKSNLDCIDWIESYLTDLGAECQKSSDVEGKANIFATLGPDVDGGIILSGHTDVVPVAGQDWSSDPFKMREDGGKLFGRGACDMKGFIAASLAMAPLYAQKTLIKPIHFAFTYDEETGCLGARVLVDELVKTGRKPSVAIIGEPTSMRIIEGHKGCCEYTTEFRGVEGHSSRPDLSVNALEYAVQFINKITELRREFPDRAPSNSRFEPRHTTSSVCALTSGVAHNVIPNVAEVQWEVRPVQPDDLKWFRSELQSFIDDGLLPEMKSKSPLANIVETFTSEVAGLMPEADSEAIDILRKLTGANSVELVSFGTEAGLFQKEGISTAICGPGNIEQAHKPDEYVSLDQLTLCLEMLERLPKHLT